MGICQSSSSVPPTNTPISNVKTEKPTSQAKNLQKKKPKVYTDDKQYAQTLELVLLSGGRKLMEEQKHEINKKDDSSRIIANTGPITIQQPYWKRTKNVARGYEQSDKPISLAPIRVIKKNENEITEAEARKRKREERRLRKQEQKLRIKNFNKNIKKAKSASTTAGISIQVVGKQNIMIGDDNLDMDKNDGDASSVELEGFDETGIPAIDWKSHAESCTLTWVMNGG